MFVTKYNDFTAEIYGFFSKRAGRRLSAPDPIDPPERLNLRMEDAARADGVSRRMACRNSGTAVARSMLDASLRRTHRGCSTEFGADIPPRFCLVPAEKNSNKYRFYTNRIESCVYKQLAHCNEKKLLYNEINRS